MPSPSVNLLRLLALPILLAAASALAAAPARKPDILFIAVDDLNDYISPLANHPGVKTPHLERLARRSVTFANAHCAAPACHPTRPPPPLSIRIGPRCSSRWR